MKISKIMLLALFFCLGPSMLLGQIREYQLLQKDWKFQKGDQSDFLKREYRDIPWEKVSVPHDWAISGPFILDGNGNTGKLPWKGEGWYALDISIPTESKGKRHYLIFDGVMSFPKIYLNGQLVGKWDYGYNSFYLDISDHIRYGAANTLMVHADTRDHDSRWYPGAGIFRKVQLLTTSPIHLGIWDTHITTPIIKEDYADVRVGTEIKNTSQEQGLIKVIYDIWDAEGVKMASTEKMDSIPAGKSKYLEGNLVLTTPRLWDVEDPYLYKAKISILANGEILDTTSTSFGVRTMEFTADDGFHLNGRRVQLKGVNLHHGHGPLGAAFNYRAMQRKLEIMKSMGVNAIRNSHNVAAPEVLELCDRMGLLFFNEIFDKYDGKADILEDTDFEEFAERNIRNFVKRDRNHPSVFLWSVGNEIGDVQWNINGGFKKLHTMVNYVRKYDPTRPVTLVNDSWRSAGLRHFEYYDVHAWNYDRRYRLARQLEPNKSVVISESASTLSTRGHYELPLPEEKTDFSKSLQVSSYDLHAPYWAEIADDDFMWQQEEEYIAGEFVWTGFDYLGEPTPYGNRSVEAMGFDDTAASRSSYFGIVDLVGIPKDRYYLYKAHWKPQEDFVHILPHWNWKGKEGDTIPVFAYTNGDSAELFINGKSQGIREKKPKSPTSVERFRLMWKQTTYEPGEVRVVAYSNHKKIAENSIRTAGKPFRIQLAPDRTRLKPNGVDLSYVTVSVLDKDGNLCPKADHEIRISVEGPADIAGVGNGNPQSFDSFISNRLQLFNGKGMIILRSGEEAGNVVLKVQSDGLRSATSTLRVNDDDK
ncbi:glycoside hydrolase family 2 TIM barrel-domain containing protein [Flagellimonas crocea]|uniref:glycoside hydrolase family 2 TIM barrel-domain containing protein n=1 Tax=Flagellimonas crocea TaxID=3067311 RepID=UPI00296F153C|nr:glycoside hydrolase family 2 TIM barrel-domain containing protein [Muricauda sp. DH64]